MHEFDKLSIIGMLAVEEINPSVLDFIERYLARETDHGRIEALATELDRLHYQQIMIGQHRGNGKILEWTKDPMAGTEKIAMEFPKS